MAGQGTRRRTRAGRSLLSVSVFTSGTESFHLGDAMVETRQIAVLPLFIDNLTAFGLLPF